ncbi:ATP-binding protein [Thermostaphylospora chromogena]|uniref:Histidine kinase-like ATPase domain-containing protein n=1 Tax=Thermostaphylospora chromogena TaxID=35622 RepID=A0A1H1DAQ5_9ACTN|nr:ATP-binding protein [Thermostaphylospora chromogena]SDQ72906.1 Histidine kinase-like ATPase domain-containing protein [Thermostaphylospora chromogena]
MTGTTREPPDGGGIAAPGTAAVVELAIWQLADHFSAVMRSRDLIRGAYTTLGMAPEVVDDAVVMVSELVTNAIQHACGPYELRLYRRGTSVVCEVVDGSHVLPRVPPPPGPPLTLGDIDAIADFERLETGRGLDVVNRLSGGRCWTHPTKTRTTDPVVMGKCVAFALDLPGAPVPASPLGPGRSPDLPGLP